MSSPQSIQSTSTTTSNMAKNWTSTTNNRFNASPESPSSLYSRRSSLMSSKVQLIPYARSPSSTISFSDAERELLSQTNFDHSDLSSKDFDFDDVFNFDKPQQTKSKVVQISSMTKERDWSSFSYSHYTAAMTARNKVNKSRMSLGEKYLKNQTDIRRLSDR